MKKAQTEVIGLLVIVILFIIIFFFYISFSGRSNDNELRQSIESSYFLRAMMFYTPVNCDEQIKEIAEDCREGNSICEKDCRELLNYEIGNILSKLDRNYEFSLMPSSGSYEPIHKISSAGCNTGIADSFKTRDIEARILIC